MKWFNASFERAVGDIASFLRVMGWRWSGVPRRASPSGSDAMALSGSARIGLPRWTRRRRSCAGLAVRQPRPAPSASRAMLAMPRALAEIGVRSGTATWIAVPPPRQSPQVRQRVDRTRTVIAGMPTPRRRRSPRRSPRLGPDPFAVVAHHQVDRPARNAAHADRNPGRPGVAMDVAQAFLDDPEHRMLLVGPQLVGPIGETLQRGAMPVRRSKPGT